MLITYIGPSRSVTIADTGQTAERGTALEVDDDVAARLVNQASWTSAKKAPAKKAPAKAPRRAQPEES